MLKEAARRVVPRSFLWGSLLALATWPGSIAGMTPQPGLDYSWQAALAMYARHGIHAGTRAIFTYGPLGFLANVHFYYRVPTLLSIAYALAMNALLYSLLVRALRRYTSLPAAVLGALIAGAPAVVLWQGSEEFLAIGLLIAVELIRSDPETPPGPAWWVLLGSAAGVNLLVKFTVGVDLALLCVISLVAWRNDRRRPAAALAGSYVVAAAIGWFGTGNSFSNFIPWLHGSFSESSGYSAAMYSTRLFPQTLPTPNYALWLVVLSAVGLGFCLWVTRRRRSEVTFPAATVGTSFSLRMVPPIRLPDPDVIENSAVAVSLFITLFFIWKEIVVRQGAELHLVLLPALFVATIGGSAARAALAGRGVPLILGSVGFLALVAFSSGGNVPPNLYNPFWDALNLERQVHTLLSGSLSAQRLAQERQALQAAYAVPQSMLSSARNATVDIDPWEQQVAWAYPELRWDPLPVVQDYAAYTPYLDQVDANFLRSRNAPRFILRTPPLSMDARVPAFDPPSAQFEMECLYRQVQATPKWQLLERVRDRCGAPRLLETVHTGYLQRVDVPAAPPNSDVVATFSLPSTPGWELLNLLYVAPGTNINLNGYGYNRFIKATGAEEHVLVPAADLGYAAGYMPEPTAWFTLDVSGRPAARSGVTVRFWSVPLRP